jgi:hypothetical protein
MLAGSTGKHIARRAGSGAAQRSARRYSDADFYRHIAARLGHAGQDEALGLFLVGQAGPFDAVLSPPGSSVTLNVSDMTAIMPAAR